MSRNSQVNSNYVFDHWPPCSYDEKLLWFESFGENFEEGFCYPVALDYVIDDFDAPALFPLKGRKGLKLCTSYSTDDLLLHPDVYDPS